MSELGDLETAVVDLIAGIEQSGEPLFRFVSGYSDADRKSGAAYLRGQVTPGALVVYTGRLRTTAADSIVGLPKLSVLIAAENLRGGDDVRSGDGDAYGGFELLAFVSTALDGAIVEADRRLIAVDEQVAFADQTRVVYEQRYVVERLSEISNPTFDGAVLAGAESMVQVVVGAVSAESVSFAFPGIDGEFRQHLGMRSRPIVWSGQLRAGSDSNLALIETNIEQAVADPSAAEMVDAWSRSFVDCVCDRFVRTGPRRRHPVTGQAIQPFELHFTQLNA